MDEKDGRKVIWSTLSPSQYWGKVNYENVISGLSASRLLKSGDLWRTGEVLVPYICTELLLTL